ncbi:MULTISPECIES: YrzQ family protein [Bacillus]|uniref:DUF3918 domain-containing protein n=1 Tax=Bacillus capparidis TaxID=1840411 RepID=A0ABS4CUR9_9BACI|nr:MULTISPECIES: YrzQ family protein [Bacillus]MBP1080906.1 hypothetical protein [Bacillus capparidis]MED1097545.1 YrzQ family protein [Bacillus capparidis]
MNRTMTSFLSMGAGAFVYHLARQYNMPTKKSMKRIRKRIMKMI